jgi:aminotransferase
MGLPFPEPQGAFYLFPEIRQFGLSDEEFCLRMIREGGVAAVPGNTFRCEGRIRISCCYSDRELEEGLNRLEQFIHTL